MAQYLELSAAPAWEFISDVRRFVGVFCLRVTQDQDAASRVALAAHELLENAVRYATTDDGCLRVEFSEADGTVAVTVRNRTSPAHIERLRALVEQINTQDPHQQYQERLRLNARHTDEPGLGLSRIRAESDMVVTLEVESPSIICLTAVGHTR